MCTCNGERFLQEQLDSIAAQTEPPMEIVVCDDVSMDGTMDILKRFRDGHPDIRITVHRNEIRLGVARNFFVCARSCTGDIVLFCDQDDVWFPDRTVAFRKAFEDDPSRVVMLCNAHLLRESMPGCSRTLWQGHHFGRRDRWDVKRGRGAEVVARQVFLTGAAIAVRRSFLTTVPEPVAPFLHDEWIGWFAGKRIGLLPRILMDYRQHEGQLTGVDPSLKSQIRRFIAPDPTRALTLEQGIEKFTSLARVLSRLEYVPHTALLEAKIDFIKTRSTLPRGPRGVLRVLRLLLEGKYSAYGNGLRTAIKDLLHKDLL
jgi:glycosyltransferase involved in cell wall biosynthesis